ncbi:hypothetical protein HDV00_004526 [Rhizophlyctis rosea]|nr:hypothetical protein HDV00_004526 [Rhizophlyctis rosea]
MVDHDNAVIQFRKGSVERRLTSGRIQPRNVDLEKEIDGPSIDLEDDSRLLEDEIELALERDLLTPARMANRQQWEYRRCAEEAELKEFEQLEKQHSPHEDDQESFVDAEEDFGEVVGNEESVELLHEHLSLDDQRK